MTITMKVTIFLAMSLPTIVPALDNGVALTPPRGFSTWNAYPTTGIDEATSVRYLDAIVSAGLPSLNYTYFIVDEPCFPGRAANGTLLENRTAWPNGISAFGARLREHGMKLGIYTCVGPTTCGGCIASEGHEDQDIATFAEWGVEYIKVDSCERNCTPAAGIHNQSTCGQELWSRYTKAIANHRTITGGQMVYSIVCNCAPGRGESPWKWGADVANSWRTNIDVQGGFGFLDNIVFCQRRMSGNGSWCPNDPKDPNGPGFPCADGQTCAENDKCPGPEAFSGPGHWNDMDMLIVGTEMNLKPPFCSNCTCVGKNCTGCDGCRRPSHWIPLTVPQAKVQVSLWTILKSPLLASADFTNTSDDMLDTLRNREVLAVSDDPLGREARRLGDSGYHDSSTGEIYVGLMEGNSHAVVFYNRNGNPTPMTLVLSDIVNDYTCAEKINGETCIPATSYAVRDLWQHTDNGTVPASGQINITVPPSEVVMITLRPTS
eukprot:m.343237 g.343237  ORF g.343237 m.343237 type:complete len:490 (+) comp22544_c0_seq1:100-1569(+)